MKKLSLILLISFFSFKSIAQKHNYFNLLGSNTSQIKAYMKHTAGILDVDRFVGGFFGVPPHQHLIYIFPLSQIKNDGIYNAIFMVTKDGGCFEYMIWYQSDKFQNALIDQLDKSGFTRTGKELKWKKANINITISKMNSNSPLLKTAFSVKWDLGQNSN